MKILMKILQTLGIIVLAFALGVIGLLWGATYGGNNGCFEFMGMLGYESCGLFFALIGVLAGLLIGLLLIRLYAKKN